MVDARKNYDNSLDEEEGNMMMLKNYYQYQSDHRQQQRQQLDKQIGHLVKQVDQGSHKLLKSYKAETAREDRLIEPLRVDMQQVLQKGVVNTLDRRGPYKNKDEKIKRCNSFIQTLQNNQAYFNYKRGQLILPGKTNLTKQQNAQDKYETIKKIVMEKINQHTIAQQPVPPKINLNFYQKNQALHNKNSNNQSNPNLDHKPLVPIPHHNDSDDDENEDQLAQHVVNPLSPAVLLAEDRELQQMKKQMATLSLKNRQFYKQVNMDQHNSQKKKLNQMKRDLVRLDKQHLKDQLSTIRRVHTQCIQFKRNKELQMFMQSTFKNEEGGAQSQEEKEQKQVQENMKKVFEEAKELLDKQLREEQKKRQKQNLTAQQQQLNQTQQNRSQLRPQSAMMQRNKSMIIQQREMGVSQIGGGQTHRVMQSSLVNKKNKRAEQTLKQVLVMTGDLIELQKAKELDYEKFVNQSYSKNDVIRSKPNESLYKIKRPTTSQPKLKKDYGIQFVAPSQMQKYNKDQMFNELSDNAKVTVQNVEQVIEYAKPKYGFTKYQTDSSNRDQTTASTNYGGLYESVTEKKTQTQTIRESLVVSPRKFHQDQAVKQIQMMMQQQQQPSPSPNKSIAKTEQLSSSKKRPQTARVDSFFEHSKNSRTLIRNRSSRGHFQQVPLIQTLQRPQSTYLSRRNPVDANINMSPGVCTGTGVEGPDEDFMKPQMMMQSQSVGNISLHQLQTQHRVKIMDTSQNQKSQISKMATQAVQMKGYEKFDDEFDTRYLDPTPQVNLVKVDKDFKTLMQTLSQSKFTHTQRMTKTILSNLHEIEKQNKKQIEAKQKYEEWKKARGVLNQTAK
ncbi:UNKNOWN [Stylonychia lemnae]|uniref:Uncharacterized protein n=1 Tax=Stylonychia lemnae TaxID=5949 RepID=A0A078BAU7_STYLE|nr:UNKNOWN [Stylonychia lemnae]|eukprot:CDW91336.1 UNKNOWN [Stylonychia lemnae]